MNDFPNLTCKQVAKLVEAVDGDGHAVFTVDDLSEESGLTGEDLSRWTHEYAGEDYAKKELGINGLWVIEDIAEFFGIGTFLQGRGRKSRVLAAKILAKLADCPDEEFVEYAKRVSNKTD